MTPPFSSQERSRTPRSRSSSAGPSRTRSTPPRRNMKDHGFAGQASWISSVINLVNTIVGAGVLAMPLALSHMGILLGVIVIIWAGVTAGFGLYLQTRCARYLERGQASFFALSTMTYPRASVIFDAAIAVKCFGVGVSYLIIIGDLMPGVVNGFSKNVGSTFLMDRHFWITAFMLIVIPFSFLRRLDSLKYTSIVALISIGYLVILVVYHFVKQDTQLDKGPVRVIETGGLHQFLASLPVMVFAYTCHQNMFSILNEMKDNAPAKTASVVTASIGSAAGTYILVAITGYLSFGDNIAGNIVSMYTPSVASTVGRAAIVVLVMFSYPLQVHPCRASVDAVLKWFGIGASQDLPSVRPGSAPLLGRDRSNTRNNKTDQITETRFATITTVIIILSYIVAMTVSSLEKVLAYVGSTGSTSISFILPGLFFYKISDPESPHHQRLLKEDDEEEEYESGDDEDEAGVVAKAGLRWPKHLTRKLALALAIYGACVMIVCLISNTYFNATH